MRVARVITGIQTEDAALAQMVDGEIAGDGEEPGLEARMAIVRTTALEDTQPCLLDEVIDGVAASEQIDEVADETEVILDDEGVQEGYVSLTKAACNSLRIGVPGHGHCPVVFKHTRGIRGRGRKLRMGSSGRDKSHPSRAKMFWLEVCGSGDICWWRGSRANVITTHPSCARMGHPAILETREK